MLPGQVVHSFNETKSKDWRIVKMKAKKKRKLRGNIIELNQDVTNQLSIRSISWISNKVTILLS